MSGDIKVQRSSEPTPFLRTLEEVLDEISKFGNPSVLKMDGGWYCKVEMFIQGHGVEFKVASDFGMATPMDAAWICMERMHSALKSVSAKTLESKET